MNYWLIASDVGLWLAVSVLSLISLVLLRQIALIHKRFLPAAGARMELEGLEIGARAPAVDVVALTGERVSLAAARGKSSLLVFVSPACSVCEGLWPGLRNLRRTERRHLEVVCFSLSADEALNRQFVESHNLGGIPYVVSAAVPTAYGVMSPPYAIVVGRQGTVTAKGLVNHLEHVESLINADRLGHATVEAFDRRAGDLSLTLGQTVAERGAAGLGGN